ncbi:hypothetical protein PMAYCL1PPCAC_02370, partial [Pristionchus mayeri]
PIVYRSIDKTMKQFDMIYIQCGSSVVRGCSSSRGGAIGCSSCSNRLLTTRCTADTLHLTLQIVLGTGLVPWSEEHEGTRDGGGVSVVVTRGNTTARLARLLRECRRESEG